ncbi:hypothetical protein MBLNU459_g6588t1 [Dothideomycetes sp. NU459]
MTSTDGASAPPSGSSTPNPRFTSQHSTTEEALKSHVVGLVQLSDFRKRHAEVVDESGPNSLANGASTPDPLFKPSKKKRKAVKRGALSFGDDEDSQDVPVAKEGSHASIPSNGTRAPSGEEEEDAPVKKKLAANTNVGFTAKSMSKAALLREAQTREQLRKEFLIMQEAVKATEFLIPFVFYSGTDIPGGVCRVKKGDFIWLFLERARKVGAEGSGSDRIRREWARVGVDDLMLVRGDIIIPHHYDFYYFMVNKTVGYNGLLFPHSAEPTSTTPLSPSQPSTPGGLSVPDPLQKTATKLQPPPPQHPDDQLEGYGQNASMTKVVDRRWYEKNKHIYPASTWEDFDPTKNYTNGVRKDGEGNAFFSSR